MAPRSVETLIAAGLIEEVEPDSDGAATLVAECRRHLVSAAQIADRDPNGAYQLLYDAARKAIGAHMLARGLRAAAKRPGGHATTGEYGRREIDDPLAADAVRRFDRIRRNRNRSEYGVVEFAQVEIESDLRHAEAIVEAVERSLV
jgi:hypothetical protein